MLDDKTWFLSALGPSVENYFPIACVDPTPT